jgi:hypothetical protein
MREDTGKYQSADLRATPSSLILFEMKSECKKNTLLALLAPFLIAAAALASSEEPIPQSPDTEQPATETAPNSQAQTLNEEEQVSEDPVEDTGEVEEVKREASYSDASLDHTVAKALFDQGYFSSANADDKENFINALKNFQTLNGMAPTGEITPEVLSKLGVGESQFSPE